MNYDEIEEYLQLSVELLYDNLESFFNTLAVPTAKSIRDSFLISLGITGVTSILGYLEIPCFITLDESLVCNIILLILTLIDGGTRSAIKGNVSKLKDIAKNYAEQLKKKSEEQEESEDGNNIDE